MQNMPAKGKYVQIQVKARKKQSQNKTSTECIEVTENKNGRRPVIQIVIKN